MGTSNMYIYNYMSMSICIYVYSVNPPPEPTFIIFQRFFQYTGQNIICTYTGFILVDKLSG